MKHVKLTGTDVGRHRRKVGNTILAWLLVIGILVIVGVIGVKLFLNAGRNSLLTKPTTKAPVIVDSETEESTDPVREQIPDTVWKEEWVSFEG